MKPASASIRRTRLEAVEPGLPYRVNEAGILIVILFFLPLCVGFVYEDWGQACGGLKILEAAKRISKNERSTSSIYF